ncbi:CG10824 [Drosophila busckii]|uniref:CG10824 n=2 Tax=Drosophila busckii TaxID=30019 RepID=A0A0M3QXC9_DROBS|nr:CG10824 [Drosophila busckii]
MEASDEVDYVALETTTEQETETETEPEPESEETTTTTERNFKLNIRTLDDNCQWQVDSSWLCTDFNFDQADQVAFFEPRTEVHIMPDMATYELREKRRVRALIMKNSTFRNMPLHLFSALPQLQELDMRQCQLQHVTWDCFLAAEQLQILLLSNNQLTQLEERNFGYANNLEYLFLSDNKLQQLHRDAFKGLSKLRHLDLSTNELQHLPAGLFDELQQLQQLSLHENRLQYLSSELLSHNTQLHTIILHTNYLSELAEQAFSFQSRLLLLDLSNNAPLELLLLQLNSSHLHARNCSLYRVNIFGSITNVDLRSNRLQELYFSSSETLEHLVLRNNSLAQLVTLTRVQRLRSLEVADNPQLRGLPSDWQTPQLERLDLSNTGLQQLPLETLRGMPHLRKLNVSANNISEIDIQSLSLLTQLTHFYIHANNWNCYNLKHVMRMLILAHGITYTADKFDNEFPGEYINGIACMYRLEQQSEPEQLQIVADSSANKLRYAQYNQVNAQAEPSAIDQVRQELKAVVQHLEAKLDGVYAQLIQLNAKMQSLERLNSSLWNQVTITV